MIDKIDGLGNVRTTAPVKRTARSSGSSGTSFAKELGETEESSASAGITGTSGISGILGVQEVEDALDHASKGRLRAEDILDRLEDLRIELLSGTISKEKLLQLSRIVSTRRASIKDPRLAEILDAIDLRAQVELAKYTS
ncbi:MAG: flagellar assembly protein FliX [Alphaproteobacteria bacterium]|nr:flagellar assembly protein FliX [Alphaproteobacteria bacterium]